MALPNNREIWESRTPRSKFHLIPAGTYHIDKIEAACGYRYSMRMDSCVASGQPAEKACCSKCWQICLVEAEIAREEVTQQMRTDASNLMRNLEAWQIKDQPGEPYDPDMPGMTMDEVTAWVNKEEEWLGTN